MDTTESVTGSGQEAELEKRLQAIIAEQSLTAQRDQVHRIATRLEVSLLDCAAALLYLNQPQPVLAAKAKASPSREPIKPNYRSVRYRLDIGTQHKVSKEQIQEVLIEESGVDKKRIGRIDIRHNYTLVELPDGMPADIFQLLSEAVIGEQKLAIKRVKPSRRRGREVGDSR